MSPGMATTSRTTRKSSRANTPRTRLSSATASSTPKVTPPTQSSSFMAPKAKSQNTLDAWMEPPPSNLRPSFEEHGLERQGVLAHMEPLGTPPSAKLKAKLRGDVNRRPLFTNGGPAVEDLYRESPDVSLSTPQTREPSARPEEVARVEPEKESEEPTWQVRHSSQYDDFDQVVAFARNKALEKSDTSTHSALKNILNDCEQNFELMQAVDGVLSTGPSKEQLAVFKTYIRRAKKAAKNMPSPPRKKLRLNLKPPKDPAAPPVLSPPKSVTQPEPSKTPQRDRSAPTRPPIFIDNSPDIEYPSPSPPIRPITMTSRTTPVKVAGNSASHDTDSDLSDVDEEIAQGPPPETLTLKANGTAKNPRPKRNVPRSAPKNKHPQGSKTRNSRRTIDDSELTDISDCDDEDEEEIQSRRRGLLRDFDDVEFPVSSFRKDRTNRDHRSTAPQTNGHVNGDYSGRYSASADLVNGIESRSATPPLSGKHLIPWDQKGWKDGVRTKVSVSPAKKKLGAATGLAPKGKGGGMEGPGGADSDLSDDDEICVACGGTGRLILCDGCGTWFHFTCCDPPIELIDVDDQNEWWCSECEFQQMRPPDEPRKGLFADLLDNIERRQPAAFALPAHVRGFFEDVNTGPDGEYEETGVWVRAKHRNGYIEPEDLTKLRDKNGTILCAQCGKSSLDGRSMLQCQVCQEHWHMDCCDPPMAVPPSVNHEWTKRLAFKCPRHINRDLKAIEPNTEHVIKAANGMSIGYKAHRIRKPKNPVFIDPALQRGFRNNGVIEVLNEETEDEFFDEEISEGAVYRIPERGIKLDFIHKAKETRLSRQQKKPRLWSTPGFNTVPIATHENFRKHSPAEQQAALNLIQLAQKEQEAGLSKHDVDSLIAALLAEAPDQVVAELTHSGTNLTNGTPKAFDRLAFLTNLEETIRKAKELLAANKATT